MKGQWKGSPSQLAGVMRGQWKVKKATGTTDDTELDADDSSENCGRKTTVLLKTLPSSLTAELLLRAIDGHFSCCYDFFYLPMNFDTWRNEGHAFINFRDALKAAEFKDHFSGFSGWPAHAKGQGSEPCSCSWALLQGYEENIREQENSKLLHENIPEDFRPWVFDEKGNRLPNKLIFKSGQQPTSELEAWGKDSWWEEDNWNGRDNSQDWYGSSHVKGNDWQKDRQKDRHEEVDPTHPRRWSAQTEPGKETSWPQTKEHIWTQKDDAGASRRWREIEENLRQGRVAAGMQDLQRVIRLEGKEEPVGPSRNWPAK
ncbi:unnamed protein product, partial [Polarella glacialis]